MKLKSFPTAARTAAFGAVIGMIAAGAFTLTSCNKQNATASVPAGQRSTGFVRDSVQPEGTGTSNGFFWSLFVQGGTANLTQGAAGNFALTYSNVTDVVAGKGFNPGAARTIGYNVGFVSGSFNSVGIYGWTTSPLIEYYVTEMGSDVGGTFVDNVSSDGHSYSFYKSQRVNEPSIIGTATFWQYKDTWGGSSTGQNHVVTMANHINNWISHGGQGFGAYNYQILALEAFSNKSGSINATVWAD
jgi:endo-1,4-beta-xylanase